MKTLSPPPAEPPRRAVVVGGGNTAVDVARELRGLGAREVTLVYRRSESRMKAYAHELAAAREEGVVLWVQAAVAEVLREGGHVRAVRIVEAERGRPTGRERAMLPVDLVVVAIGQAGAAPLASLFPGVACDEGGRIVVDPATGRTGNPRVFAGGDAVNGGKEVVNAVHEGQLAARSIDALLRAGPGEPPPVSPSAAQEESRA